jgi:putative flippase GtrA
VAGLSVIAVLIALWRANVLRALRRGEFTWDAPACRASAATLLVLSAIVLNAGICGMLAGVFARYQSRVVWLLPAVAMLLPLALVPEAVWRRSNLALSERWQALVDAARATPVGAWAMRIWDGLDPALLRFGVVGVVGFVTDAGMLQFLTGPVRLDPFLGQAIAFPIAVLATWLLNRTWTFPGARAQSRLRQAAVYFGVQLGGFATNYVVYAGALVALPALRHWLVAPLALGALAALCVTFLGAKHLAFRAAHAPTVPVEPAAKAPQVKAPEAPAAVADTPVA